MARLPTTRGTDTAGAALGRPGREDDFRRVWQTGAMRSKVLRYAVPFLAVLLAVASGAVGLHPLAVAPVAAQDAGQAEAEDRTREYRIKAAFIYNFAKFTEWPANSFADRGAPLRICVYGEDPFGAALEGIAGKTVQGRRVEIARLDELSSGDACHLLFISESEAPNLAGILAELQRQPILTVADMPGFADAGGIINLKINEEEKIRFEINVAKARLAGLRLSAKLLSLAEIAQY